MPHIFEQHINRRAASAEYVEMMRSAYVSAVATLGLSDGTPEARLALVEILQEVAELEVFRNPDAIARLASDLYRARRGK